MPLSLPVSKRNAGPVPRLPGGRFSAPGPASPHGEVRASLAAPRPARSGHAAKVRQWRKPSRAAVKKPKKTIDKYISRWRPARSEIKGGLCRKERKVS